MHIAEWAELPSMHERQRRRFASACAVCLPWHCARGGGDALLFLMMTEKDYDWKRIDDLSCTVYGIPTVGTGRFTVYLVNYILFIPYNYNDDIYRCLVQVPIQLHPFTRFWLEKYRYRTVLRHIIRPTSKHKATAGDDAFFEHPCAPRRGAPGHHCGRVRHARV